MFRIPALGPDTAAFIYEPQQEPSLGFCLSQFYPTAAKVIGAETEDHTGAVQQVPHTDFKDVGSTEKCGFPNIPLSF